MLRIQQPRFPQQQPQALGATSPCPSPLWYIVGGAVGWAFFGDVAKSLLGLSSKAAVHGISKVGRKIPPAREGGKKIEVDTVTLPAAWASALVNGDVSGMEDDEIAAMEKELARLSKDGWEVVSNADDSEPYFTWKYRLYGGTADGGEVMDYVVHRYR